MNNVNEINPTRIITMTLGILFAIAAFSHGFFEALQGNTPTDSLIIQAIGTNIQMWKYGTEEAFTLIPNFLFAGIITMCISIVIIYWSIFFIDKKHGVTVFLMLFILSFLAGGGIAQVLFFMIIWAYATRVNKPLNLWKNILPSGFRVKISRIWPYSFIIACLTFLIALEIAVFGYFPNIHNPDSLLYFCWSLLLVSLISINISYVSGFSYIIKNKND